MRVDGVRCNNDKNIEALKNIRFELRAGEILGVAGVSGNGQAELAEVLTGLRKVTAGTITLNDKDVTNCPPAEVYKNKLSHVPEDRHAVGLVMDFNLAENSVVGCFKNEPYSTRGVMHYRLIDEHAANIMKKYDVRAPGIETTVRLLSGGNQQKLILGREIEKSRMCSSRCSPRAGLTSPPRIHPGANSRPTRQGLRRALYIHRAGKKFSK